MNIVAPRIHHMGKRPESGLIKDVVAEACNAIHATGRSERLLQLYGDCGEGFAPSLKLIEERTGIPANKISMIRQELVSLGMIAYDAEEHLIQVDWKRIALYSSLDPDLTSRNKKHAFFTPAFSGGVGKEIGSWDDRIRRKLTDAQRHFYKTVEGMTPMEWSCLMEYIGFHIPTADESFLDGIIQQLPDNWEDYGIDEACPKTYGPIIDLAPLPF